ncbi:hypothetical protein [Streptosporangium sp. V21-05]|uniref:hypothetical protein n=1 Tax=Streptosporangium sp. V21-05 TaxID=3446115 RepID=UPI003F530980
MAPPTIAQAVRQVFLLGERERASFSPPLSSFCFPLVGTGRGRVPLETGVRWLWTALLDNLGHHPRWAVHLSVPLPEVAEAVVRALSDRGAGWA